MPAETTREGVAPVHRIPSLDGLRALSIFLVLALHSIQRLEVTSPVCKSKDASLVISRARQHIDRRRFLTSEKILNRWDIMSECIR